MQDRKGKLICFGEGERLVLRSLKSLIATGRSCQARVPVWRHVRARTAVLFTSEVQTTYAMKHNPKSDSVNCTVVWHAKLLTNSEIGRPGRTRQYSYRVKGNLRLKCRRQNELSGRPMPCVCSLDSAPARLPKAPPPKSPSPRPASAFPLVHCSPSLAVCHGLRACQRDPYPEPSSVGDRARKSLLQSGMYFNLILFY